MNLFDDPRVGEILGHELAGVLNTVFRQMEVAEQEIAAARDGETEPDAADPLWAAFPLMRATHKLMRTEFVYRAHCRELLERVRKGEDTRPATDAEIAANVSEASQSAPMHGAIVGLQGRLFKRAFPEQFEKIGLDLDSYERMYGSDIDQWERDLRRKGSQSWRVIALPPN